LVINDSSIGSSPHFAGCRKTERTIMQTQSEKQPPGWTAQVPPYLSGYLRINQVLQLIPVGKSTFWHWVKTGKAPAPVKLSERVTAWKSEDIYNFIAELGKGGA
jgi:predicted DNA-binding transcriptional regulator AlpA